jgi:hypothetical protein
MNLPQGFAHPRSHHEGHWFLALSALILSVSLHLLILAYIADMRLDAIDLADRARDKTETQPPPMPPLRVERLPQDPFRPSSVERPDRPVQAPDAAREKPEQPELASPLKPATKDQVADTMPASAYRDAISTRAPMIPRQDVVAVLEKRIDNRLAALKRREVSLVERRPKAPDFAPAVDAAARRFEGGTGLRPANMPFGFAGLQDGHLPSSSDPTRPSRPTRLANEARTNAAAVLSERFAKPPENAQRFVAMDDRLAIAFHAYREPQEGGRLYFRIAIQPRTDKPMPVLPKDLLLVQDSSASLAEERLYFSRLALADSLSQLGPSDRFNVLAFSDQSTLCFPAWVPVNETNRAAARTFIGALRSTGETDLFASLQRMLEIPRDPERPLVVVMVTDGRPTAGRLASTEIIGAFTKLNDGALSIFGFGTHARANTYLLDMLTYCNRGETRLNRVSRWTLQKEITDFVASVRQPVMHDIRFAFDAASGSEVYPKQTTSLYADRPLELFGSCAGDVRELALHMRGRAGGSNYDAVIQLDVARDAQAGEIELRTRWAWQRMYHVIGLYARDPKPLYLRALERLNADYGIPIPYGKEMGR